MGPWGESAVTRRSPLASLLALLATLATIAATLFIAPATASAQAVADPSRQGPLATSRTQVPSSVSGFGGGFIDAPTSGGPYAGIALSPGFTARASSLSWVGPRLASHGFVVITIETNSTSDQPDSRGSQLQAALNYLTRSSAVRTRVDPNRLAVGGHSMGGGGTLRAAANNPALKAALPLAPWHGTKSWSSVRVPTMIIAGSSDTVASTSSHARRFYDSIPSSTEKGLVEISGASHFFPQSTNATMSRYMVSWLKVFADGNSAYAGFACERASGLSIYQTTCPLPGGGTGPNPTTPPPTTPPPPPPSECRWYQWWCR